MQRDEDALHRLADAVGSHPGLELVPGADPDVAVVDSAEAIRELRAGSPDVHCVALCAEGEMGEAVEMLAAGAATCLPMSAAAPAIVTAIQSAGVERVQIDRELAAALFTGLAQKLGTGPAAAAADTEQRAARVRQLIGERSYEMVFQPLVALQGSEVLGVEALARFSTEERRPPNVWLAEAEAVGLRCELEEGLLRAALAAEPHLPPGAFLTVNLSPEAVLAGVLERAIPASLLRRVVVEITDHQDVGDYAALAGALAGPRAAGLRVALDDSGQSLSSLHEVLRLAPDFIKLNRALVRDIDRDPTRRALAFALHSVAAQIGASVVAEGIETTAELQALRGLGVPYGQGYLIGRPQPLSGAFATPSLPDHAAETSEAPPILLPGRAMRSFRDAARAAFSLLERELPGSGILLAQLDHKTRRYRVVALSDALAGEIEPGFSLPLAGSLCAHMMSGRGARVCDDAGLDAVYGALELQSMLGIRSYVGVPLELAGATRLGSLCAVAREPDRYDERTLEMLQALAPVLMSALENELAESDGVSPVDHLHRIAATDHLTDTLNRLSFLERLEKEARGQSRRNPRKFVAHVEIDGIDGIRERYGRAVGELVMKDLADALAGAGRPGDVAGRIGDAEFGVVLLARETPEQAPYYCSLVGKQLEELFGKRGVAAKARAGVGTLDGTPGHEVLASARAAAQPLV